MKKILLVGNPNVGKSTLFSRLTGVNVMISNYPGTTVGFKQGKSKVDGEIATIIDVPGTNTLHATCKAERVCTNMIKEGDVIINVIDSTNLERNLFLTLQLLEQNIPVIVALNFWNETRHKGISIDVTRLEKILKVPVVTTTAITGEGVKRLISRIGEAKRQKLKLDDKKRWNMIGDIVTKVQKVTSKRHTFLERLEDLTIKPRTGLPIALLVLILFFYLIRIIGENLITYVFEPLFEMFRPLLDSFSSMLGNSGLLHDIMIGKLINGEIDFIQSMGLLTTGLFVPIAMILPYVFAFYLVLGFIEDLGYLPRLSVLIDNLMHKIGMHGLAIIPMMLGLGCNVPGAMATRILETERQRFIAITATAIAVPCMAQTAMIYGLLGPYGIKGLGIVFLTLFAVWLIISYGLNKMMKGVVPETFVEITPYRVPYLKGILKKTWMRLRCFFTEAIPYMLIGIIFINILYMTGIIDFIGNIAAPMVVSILGLPKEAVGSLIVGFMRKDVAVGMLIPLGLTMKQLIISSVVLTMYFPCVATFIVIFKEMGMKRTVQSIGIMIIATAIVGGLLNLIL